MLNKYDFTNNDDVIDQPSILKITSDQVQIIHASGTDTEEIPEEGLVIQIGNIDSFIPPTPDPIDPDDPEPTPSPDPTPDPGPDPDPDPQPSGDGNISFTLVNNCGYEVRLCGEANLNIYRNPTDSHGDYAAQLGVHIKGQHSSDWTNNDIILQPGGTKSWTATIDNGYLTGNYYICKNDSPYWAGPIFIYSKYYSVSRSSVQHGNGMYFTDTETQALQANKNYTFTITKMNEDAILADTSTTVTSLVSSGKRYAILYEGQTSLPQ